MDQKSMFRKYRNQQWIKIVGPKQIIFVKNDGLGNLGYGVSENLCDSDVKTVNEFEKCTELEFESEFKKVTDSLAKHNM